MSASSTRSLVSEKLPADVSPRERLAFALRYAALTPTQTNRQEWDYRLTDTHLELITRNDRAHDVTDPDRRESIVRCGAVLACLKLTLRHLGCLGRVALFPDIGDPALVARIHLGSCREGDPQEAQLFEGMTSRPSDDPGPERSQVLDAVLIALKNAVAGEQAWLDFAQNEISREFVLKVTPATDRLGVRVGPFRLRPPERPALREISRWPWTLFSPRHRSEESWDGGIDFVAQSIRASATLAVVKSKTDDKHGWLAAGQVMARTILQSQALGINCTLHDPLRRSEARAALRLGVGHKGFAQIILRFPPLAAPQRAVMGPPISLGDSDSRS